VDALPAHRRKRNVEIFDGLHWQRHELKPQAVGCACNLLDNPHMGRSGRVLEDCDPCGVWNGFFQRLKAFRAEF